MLYTWFKVFFVFFFRRKIWRKSRISKAGYWNLLPHSFDTPLLYRKRKLNSYPVLPCINQFCIKKLKMKYTVCRDLKSDHESLLERHCIRGWINNPFAKKEKTDSRKEKKKFPSNKNDLNEYLKILPGQKTIFEVTFFSPCFTSKANLVDVLSTFIQFTCLSKVGLHCMAIEVLLYFSFYVKYFRK